MTAKPQLWVIAGPNGAGKSTLAQKYLAGRLPIVNPDDIARAMFPAQPAAPMILLQAGRLAITDRRARLERGESFAIETTMTGRGELNFMREAADRGYKINLVFVGVRSVEHSRSRVAERVRSGGHPVPDADILRRFDRSLANLAPAIRLAHRALVLDNSGERTRLLLSRENGRTRRVTQRMPGWAKNAIPAALRRDHSAGQGY